MNNYAELQGKVALITGAGHPQGIGATIAARLAQEGCRIVLTDLMSATEPTSDQAHADAQMQAVAQNIRALNTKVLTFDCDVSSEAAVQKAINETIKAFGALDILVNNAGVGYLMQPIVDMAIEDWDTVLNVNLRGPFLGIKHAAPHMIKQGSGCIINIGSQASKSGFGHASAYTSSKHGLVGLTRVAAMELGPAGIRVNTLCPNHITTGLGAWQNDHFSKLQGLTEADYLAAMRARIPLGRLGLQQDIANACAFLVSEQACYITGECMNVSGGEEYH